jgi:AbrB family looped-hinge helix DNA binding protein
MPLITKKGQVTVPKDIREELGIREGDSLVFLRKEGEVVMRRQERKSILTLGGIVRGRVRGEDEVAGEAGGGNG